MPNCAGILAGGSPLRMASLMNFRFKTKLVDSPLANKATALKPPSWDLWVVNAEEGLSPAASDESFSFDTSCRLTKV